MKHSHLKVSNSLHEQLIKNLKLKKLDASDGQSFNFEEQFLDEFIEMKLEMDWWKNKSI